jgi:hypothetical protein
MKLSRTRATIGFLIMCIHLPAIQSQQQPGLRVQVVDERGIGIGDVTIIGSGAGPYSYAKSDSDGFSQLGAAGAFVLFRHTGFKPRLMATSELASSNRIVGLDRADETIWTVPSCESLPNGGRGWVGGGLRVNALKTHYDGPVRGLHDSHWYVKHNHQILHIVHGILWHKGLPAESILTESKNTRIRGWVYHGTVGVDLSGQARSGSRWRWVGAPFDDAIEYENTSQKAANYFDKVIETMCVGWP